MGYQDKRIAIVHDHLGFQGGGERTVLLLARELQADFITAYAHQGTYPEYQAELGGKMKILSQKVINVRVVRFFWLRWLFWKNRGLFKKYDILIASSQTATEAVAFYARRRSLKIVYTHTTPRRVFDLYAVSKSMYPFVFRPAYALFARFWKWKYLRAIRRFDLNIANSNNVRKRIKEHTRGDASAVAWPPIMTDKFKWIEAGDYYLSFGRVDEAKRIELIVEAFKRMPDKKLVIASGGPRLEAIKKLAQGHGNIRIAGWVSDRELVDLVGRSRATIYIPIDEDAGMTHLESNVAGKPYLGVKEGGLVESTVDGETGILLPPDPKAEDLVKGIKKMTKDWCLSKKEACQSHAAAYDQRIFFKKIRRLLEKNDQDKRILGLDASRWEDPRRPGKRERTGVEAYSKDVIKSLLKAACRKGLRTRVYTSRTIKSLPLDSQKVIPLRRGWTRKCLKKEMKYSPVDFFFTPGYYIPAGAPEKSFAVIHDIVFKTDPERYSFIERMKQGYALRQNIKRAFKLFTVSGHSRRELIDNYDLDKKKVVAVPMGYERKATPYFGPREKNILYIGRLEKKKSLDVLLRAFKSFDKKKNGYKLVLAGAGSFGALEIRRLAEELGLGKKAVFLGYVSEEKKWRLLKTSSMFVHPGAHEGSAIPLLEAWDAGLPVICSDAPALKEVAEDGAVFFRAGDHEDLGNKMLELADGENLQKTAALKGGKNLSGHDWTKISRIILKEIVK